MWKFHDFVSPRSSKSTATQKLQEAQGKAEVSVEKGTNSVMFDEGERIRIVSRQFFSSRSVRLRNPGVCLGPEPSIKMLR